MTASSKTAAIILAAGESRRMGFPKALLEVEGETFADRIVTTLSASCAPVILVLGAESERIAGGLKTRPYIVTNPDWAIGQITSLQAGLRALPPDIAGVLFTLVDHPATAAETAAALVRSEARVAIPRYHGRRGHPVYFDASLIPEFLAVPEDGAARDVIDRHQSEVLYLDVADAGILDDIDTPEAYQRLAGAL